MLLVLGEARDIASVSLDTITAPGIYNIRDATDNPFGNAANAIMVVYTTTFDISFMVLQTAYRNGENPKMRWRWANTWQSWVNVAVDIPSFYKNYADLNSLSSALGIESMSYSCWDASSTIDTGMVVKTSSYLLLFRCQIGATAEDYSVVSYIIPIVVGNNREGVWRGSSIDIKTDSQHPSSDVQFSISTNKTLKITGSYGAVRITAIRTP